MTIPIIHASRIVLPLLVIFGQVEPQPERQFAPTTSSHRDRTRMAPLPENIPPAIAAEIKSIDAAHQSIRVNQAISRWQFDAIRSRYEAISKRANGDASIEETIRTRLDRLARDERSAKAARTIEDILAQSHRRDRQVATDERQAAAAVRAHARAFNAAGYVQASSAMLDGRKLYILIANDGSTIAYLDVPPGLDIDPLLSRRIGVRGEPHFDEDLGARLITVRDVENLSR